jgi:hypothetical protein
MEAAAAGADVRSAREDPRRTRAVAIAGPGSIEVDVSDEPASFPEAELRTAAKIGRAPTAVKSRNTQRHLPNWSPKLSGQRLA